MTRLGHADQPVIWQGAKPHGLVPVGLSKNPAHKHGNVGCVNAATAWLMRVLGVRAGAMPLDVHRAAVARGTTVYSDPERPAAAIVPEVVRSMRGLRVGVDLAGAGVVAEHEAAHDLIVETLRAEGACLVCVDYDAHLPKGDATGEHWTGAHAIQDGRLFMGDPATAKIESIDLETLRGPVRWGRVVRPYHVVRVISVFRD